ncbi:MAG: tripartite tricarboxylate transporter substrate binding protein, partial [Betaproteobacteria bacterium]|nr:tripartite tricarboxylate transporter substrate binding protein [Betaproteobacteria bacterium]
MKTLITLLAATAAFALPAHAQKAWSPSRNVEIVVGSAPGGSNDKTARAVEKALTDAKLVPTSLTVVNRPGGGSTIAFAYVRQKRADP